MPLAIRRPWTIPARQESDDRAEDRQRRLLDEELQRWTSTRPAPAPPRPAPTPEEGPIRLGDLAEGFAPASVLEQQGAAFRGERPGAREAQAFGETVRALPARDRVRLSALARELDRRNMTPQDLVSLSRPGAPTIGAREARPGEQVPNLPGDLRERVAAVLRAQAAPEEREQATFREIREAVEADSEVQAADAMGPKPLPRNFQEQVLRSGAADPVEALLGVDRVRALRGQGAQEDLLGAIITDFVTFGGSTVANQLIEGDIEGAIETAALVGVPVTALSVGSRALRAAGDARRVAQLAREAQAGRAAQGAPLETAGVRRGLEAAEEVVPEAAEQVARQAPVRQAAELEARADALARRAPLEAGAVEPAGAVRAAEAAPPPPARALDDELSRIDPDLAAGREPAPMRGVGAAEAELPTMRAVEAQSARIPIEDKRAVATEILANTAPDARPLSVDEVAAQWGDRYRKNWFTKLDDVIAPLRGRDRALEKSVRDTMVTRDLYTHQEGYIQLQRVNAWMGRNMETLGLRYEARIPGAEGRWVARGVEPRPGTKIPRGALQRLKDIRERPGDYIITPDQQRALDEAGNLFEQMKLSNFQHGVDFQAVDSATYWPGIVTNAPKRSGIPIYRGAAADLTSPPRWAKARQVPTMREGLAAGANYADDLEAMTIRLSGGAQANGDRWAVQQVQGLGLKPTEKVSERLSQNLRDAREAFKDARALARKTGEAVDRQAAIEAQIALDGAKAAMRAEANRVSALRPRVFGRVVAPDVAEELSRYLTTENPGVVEDVLQLWRGTMVTGDHSSLLLQNMTLFWRNNPAWMRAAGYSSMAFKEAPYAWAARNADDVEAAIRLGFASPPTEFLLRQGGGVSQFFGSLPVVRQSQRAFEWNIFIGQVERYKAAKTMGLDQQALMDMAAVTRKQAGILWMPGKTRAQAKVQSATFFAPQYTVAITTTLTDPLTTSGAARREALKSLGLMFGGAASATIGFNMLINGEMPNIDRPENPGYWGIRLGGGFVYPLGPYQPLVRALALSAPHKNKQGKWVKGDPKAVPRLIEGKASVLARLLLRAFEAMGAPLESIRGPSFSDPTKTFGERGLGESFRDIAPAPIGAEQAVEGLRGGAPITLLEPLGGRTTVETPFQKFQRLYQEKYGTPPRPDISPRTLDPDLAQEAGYGPARETEFGRERGSVTAEEEGRLADLSRIVLQGNPDAMEQFEEELGDFFRFRSGVTETLVRDLGLPEREASLVQDFYDLDPRDRRDPETGRPDWDFFENRRNVILASLRREGASGREAANALERGTGITFSDPGLQRVYDARRELREGLDGYYDEESGTPRASYRRANPEIDAQLYLLGRVSIVQSRAAQEQVRTLSRRLLGTEVEAGRGERSGGGLGDPIRIGPIEPIRLGQ